VATEPKKPAGSAKSPGRATKPAPAAPDATAIAARLSTLESGLEAVEKRLGQRTAALEARIGALEERGTSAPKVNLPAGTPDGVRQFIDRAADLIRHNPITALILIVAFLLVAIFN